MGSYLTVIFHSRITKTSLNGWTIFNDVTIVRGFLCRIFVSTTERWTRLVFVLYSYQFERNRLEEMFY